MGAPTVPEIRAQLRLVELELERVVKSKNPMVPPEVKSAAEHLSVLLQMIVNEVAVWR